MSNRPVTEDEWLRMLNDYLKLKGRIEELENHKDDWKIWLEGFKEGFTIRNKKEKK